MRTVLLTAAVPKTLAAAVVVLLSFPLQGCRAEPGQTANPESLASMDAVLAELGGKPTADLSRGQRWRMISSVGAGLPPSIWEVRDLPDFGSRGATLMAVYCERCHGIPAPQMHSAAEWPILMRRMVMRARTLALHMGGPITDQMMGEILMSGMASADIPSTEEIQEMVAYAQQHALPTTDDATLADTPDGAFFVERCSQCHETPAPDAHPAAKWRGVVDRMRSNALLMDVPPISEEEAARITAWLESRSGS